MSVFSLCFPPIFLVYSGNLSYKKIHNGIPDSKIQSKIANRLIPVVGIGNHEC